MIEWHDVLRDDPEVAAAIACEQRRQRDKIELIASENYTSAAVLAAVGSVLTNKYAEGYPGRRYYGGCECVDQVERLAIRRAKELFGAEHANVQPHSGASANQAVYGAFAAITCSSGPPWIPGKIALSIAFACCARQRISPPRGPRSVLCVVSVTTSA